MPKRKMTLDPELAEEAKSIVAWAFRNGPIEDIHAGKDCLSFLGKSEYSYITQTEMKKIMKKAVDTVYKLLWLMHVAHSKEGGSLPLHRDQHDFA